MRGSKTPGARSLAHEGFNGLFPRVGGQQSLNEKTLPLKLQMIDGSHNHMQDRKDEKTYFRVKTMQDGVRLSVATITRSSSIFI